MPTSLESIRGLGKRGKTLSVEVADLGYEVVTSPGTGDVPDGGGSQSTRPNAAPRLCPVCDGVGDRVWRQEYAGYPGQWIRKCSCGMVYADSGEGQGWYDEYYMRYNKYGDVGGESIPDDSRRHIAIVELVEEYIGIAGTAAKVLDYGCANGKLIECFRSFGFQNVSGYEVGDRISGNYDCITLSHVLEHVYDVGGFMKGLIERLSGILYVEVPDASGYNPEYGLQDFNVEHVNHFTRSTLAGLCGRFGLYPVEMGEKVFKVGDGNPLKAIWGIFQKDNGFDVEKYIQESRRVLEAMDLEKLGPVVVWGAGQLALKILPRLKVVALTDSNPSIQGTEIAGHKVVPPSEIPADAPILVASILNREGILRSITQREIKNRVICL